MAKIFNNNNLVKVWDVRLSGRRLASISGKKGSGNNSNIKLKYDGWLRLSGATFQDGSVRKLFLGDLTIENIQIYTERFNLIFESPRELNELIFSFDDTTEYLVDLRQFQHLKFLTGGVGLSVKGRNQELEKLTYFGDKGDYSRAGLNFKTGWYFKADGDGTGIATMWLTASEATELQADGNVLFCDLEGGNETTTVSLVAGDNVIYFKCEYEDGDIYIQNDKIIQLGTESLSLFGLPANAPIPFIQTAEFYNLECVRIITTSELNLFGGPPSGVTYWNLGGSNIFWTYTGAPPSGVTYWSLGGSNIFWTYTGAPPSGVTQWYLNGSNINNINTNFSGNSNYTTFRISDWRIEKIGDTELIEILNSLKNRVGALPSTITIGDYLNYANPPQEVVDTVETLKIAKNINTVTLSI